MIKIDPKRIKEARGSMKQVELATRIEKIIGCHFTSASISAWEKGRSVPSQLALAALCKATGKTPNFFFGLKDSELLSNNSDGKAL